MMNIFVGSLTLIPTIDDDPSILSKVLTKAFSKSSSSCNKNSIKLQATSVSVSELNEYPLFFKKSFNSW